MRDLSPVFAKVRALLQSERARTDLFGELKQAFIYDYRLGGEELARFDEEFGAYLESALSRACLETERVLELDVWMRKTQRRTRTHEMPQMEVVRLHVHDALGRKRISKTVTTALRHVVCTF